MTTWNLSGMKSHLFICNGSSCMKKGAEEITLAIREEIAQLGMDEQIHTTRTRCNGRCKDACIVIAYPQGSWYKASTTDIGRGIVKDCIEQQNEQHTIYRMENGEMILNPEVASITGIDKNK
ncbi:(2Fe-2S) ferredoxin domain-containing protein [Rummeliibacillus sp. NPDC094406]|uniref:(2Fe-2S) ferredoxin domain-containing protein n=1 Tax=Rummeliibacillus sp. NPDC094406 TaxID=3364511 RepID=UPI00380A78EB